MGRRGQWGEPKAKVRVTNTINGVAQAFKVKF